MKPSGGLSPAALGWALAVAGVAAGYIGYGWPGVALAFTAIVFWLLLQFSRSLRVLREAGANPVGHVASAVMLHAKMHTGMRLPDILKITRSLGRRLDEPDAPGPERYVWVDEAGDEVRVELREGRVTQWDLVRVAA